MAERMARVDQETALAAQAPMEARRQAGVAQEGEPGVVGVAQAVEGGIQEVQVVEVADGRVEDRIEAAAGGESQLEGQPPTEGNNTDVVNAAVAQAEQATQRGETVDVAATTAPQTERPGGASRDIFVGHRGAQRVDQRPGIVRPGGRPAQEEVARAPLT